MRERSRPRKDLAASFNRLRRMVGDIKSARKSLAAHHSFVAELMSVSLFSAVPSSPRSPTYNLWLDGSQAVGNACSTLSRKPTAPGPQIPPCNLQLDDLQEVGIASPILQIDDSQEVGFPSLIPVSCSVLPSTNSSRLPASKISASPKPLPTLSVWSGGLSPLFCKNRDEADCVTNKIFMAFWATLLFVFVCFFLCIGKVAAVGVTITAYFIISLTFKGQSFSKQISRYMFPGHSMEFHFQAKQSMRLTRSLTHVNDILVSSSESHCCTRSQSLPALHGCAQEEVYRSEPALSIYAAPSLTSVSNVRTDSSRIKLGIMMVLALCGLAHGQIMAVCMCSCCILIFSEIQRLASKRCKQELQYNSQCSC